jgi:hypothetical protein
MSEAYNKDRIKQKAKVITDDRKDRIMLEKNAKKLDVVNFTGRTGRPVPNQFIITDGQNKAFKSYNSIIVEQRGAGGGYDDVIIFGKDYNYSTTTSKYLNKFLEMLGYKEIANSRDREKAIEKGMFYSGNKAIYVSVDDTL